MSSVNMFPNADTPKTPEQELIDSIVEINMRIDAVNKKAASALQALAFSEWELIQYAYYLQELVGDKKHLTPKELETNREQLCRFIRALESIDSNLNRIMFYIDPDNR